MCQKKNRLKNCNETDEPLSYSHGALDSPNRDSIVLLSRKIWDTTKRWGRTRSWLGVPSNRRRHCQSVAATCKLVSMPELPDISAYISALESRILGQPLEHIRLNSAFLLRTAQPPLASAEGRMVRGLRRIGKRIVIGVDNDVWLHADGDGLALEVTRLAALAPAAQRRLLRFAAEQLGAAPDFAATEALRTSAPAGGAGPRV